MAANVIHSGYEIRKSERECRYNYTADSTLDFEHQDAVGLDPATGIARPFQPGDCFVGIQPCKECNPTTVCPGTGMELCLEMDNGPLDLTTVPLLPKNGIYVNATGPRSFETGPFGPDTIGAITQVQNAKKAWVRIFGQIELAAHA